MTKNSQNNLPAAPDAIIGLVEGKDQQELCREVLAIGDTMDVLRGKWTVEVLTAIVCSNTLSRRFSPLFTASATRCSPSVCAQCRTTASSSAANTPHPPIPLPITAATSLHSSTACPPGVSTTAALCSAERALRKIYKLFSAIMR